MIEINLVKDSYVSFVNLNHRNDRLDHMSEQLSRIGLPAERERGMLPDEFIHNPNFDKFKLKGMIKRGTLGAIGCHYSQVSIMEKALILNKHAWVMEDDLIFCGDFEKRIEYIDKWTSENEWDVFWLGASVHSPAYWHKKGHDIELPQCDCTLEKDLEPTDDLRIIKTYGAFCTFAYIVNTKSLDKILSLLDEKVHLSMGIDWLFILIQRHLNCFSFVPGCIRQMDGQSDIGQGVTNWSGFLSLNGTVENSAYVYQEKMESFEPENWKWL